MPTQLAVDLSRIRARAVEIDGTAKSPKVRSFTAADAPQPAPVAEGETPAPFSYGEALRALASQRRLAKDPAAVAIASVDCTFRELELPFTTADQIDKVVKFEAESHLQLVEIDSVVVAWQLLDHDGRGGSRLLVAACSKETIRGVLRDCGAIGVDPHLADLHLTALYGALRHTGYLVAPPPPPADVPPDQAPRGETVVVVECDADLTNLLVVRGDTLLAARALRFGWSGAAPSSAPQLPAGADAAKHDGDETLLVVDDLGDDGKATKRGGLDFHARLRREIQRALFKLGPAAAEPARILLLGQASRSAEFVAHLESTMRTTVEVAKPFDRVPHDLDEETLAVANAEGAAALGLALRLAGDNGGSRVDFRQEEVRYARRFDQVKVALASFAIVALVCVFLACVERYKTWRTRSNTLLYAVNAIVNEHSQRLQSNALYDDAVAHPDLLVQVAQKARDELKKYLANLSFQLGRSGTIPRVPSGLDYLNSVVVAIDRHMPQIGRLQLTVIDLDVSKDSPTLKLSGLLNTPEAADVLVKAIRSSPAVLHVDEPSTSPYKDGRVQIQNLEVKLVPDFDPRGSAKGGKK